MVNTRSSTSQEDVSSVESLAQQLSAIASKLITIDSLATDVAILKSPDWSQPTRKTTYRTRDRGKNAMFGKKRKKTSILQGGQTIFAIGHTQRWIFLDLKEGTLEVGV